MANPPAHYSHMSSGPYSDDEPDEDDDVAFASYRDFHQPNRSSRSTFPLSPSTPSSTRKDGSELPQDFFAPAPILDRRDWAPGESSRREEGKETKLEVMGKKAKVGTVKALETSGGWLKRRWRVLGGVVGAFLVALAITLYFVVPRAPSISFSTNDALVSTDPSPYVSSNLPTTFHFVANLTLAIDSTANYIPIKFTSLQIALFLNSTNVEIANATQSSFSVPGRQVTQHTLPITFYGAYSSSTDPTYQAIRAACTHIYPTLERPMLSLLLTTTASILGHVGTTVSRSTIEGLVCPVEFSGSAS